MINMNNGYEVTNPNRLARMESITMQGSRVVSEFEDATSQVFWGLGGLRYSGEVAIEGKGTDLVEVGAGIERLRTVRAEIDAYELAVSMQLRGEGATWEEVGRVFGTTKQAAQQRFGRL